MTDFFRLIRLSDAETAEVHAAAGQMRSDHGSHAGAVAAEMLRRAEAGYRSGRVEPTKRLHAAKRVRALGMLTTWLSAEASTQQLLPEAKAPAGDDSASLRAHILAAIVRAVAEAKQAGKDPGPVVAELKRLATPEGLAELRDAMGRMHRLGLSVEGVAWLAWERGTSSRGRTRWRDSATGELRYQEGEPGTRRAAQAATSSSSRSGPSFGDKMRHGQPSLWDQLGKEAYKPEPKTEQRQPAPQTVPGERQPAPAAAPTPHQVPPAPVSEHQAAANVASLADHIVNMEPAALADAQQKIAEWSVNGQRLHPNVVETVRSYAEAKIEHATGTPSAERIPGKAYNVPTKSLKVDPARFQYKLNTDRSGVGADWKTIQKFEPEFAGTIHAWWDPEKNQGFVVNGHHRHWLADRDNAPTMNVQWIDAKTAKEARAKGALINIAGLRGTAIDAAKYMRDTGTTPDEIAGRGVNLKEKMVDEAVALTRISEPLFHRVTIGAFDPATAIAIGRHLPDHDLQNQLVGLLDKRQREGKEIPTRNVEEMAREMAATPTTERTEASLFGDLTSTTSLFEERAELKAHIRQELAREASTFAAISSKKRKERLGEAGNQLDVAKNTQLGQQAEELKSAYNALVNSKGPISNAINTAAVQMAGAKTKGERDAIKQQAFGSVRNAAGAEFHRKALGEGEGGDAGLAGEADAYESAAAAAAAARKPGRGAADAPGLNGEPVILHRPAGDEPGQLARYSPVHRDAEFRSDSGKVATEKVRFRNLLAAKDSKDLRRQLRLKPAATSAEVAAAAKQKGYDGISFESANGREYVGLGNHHAEPHEYTPEPPKPAKPATPETKEQPADDKSPLHGEKAFGPPVAATPPSKIERSSGLTTESQAIEAKAIHKVEHDYPTLRAQYLDPKKGNATLDKDGSLRSVALNTDEWRDLFEGYDGTNAAAVHEPSSFANKQLLTEMLKEQKGKGNNRVAVYAGGGGCHGIDTPIMMFDGSIKAVQDIAVGDALMGPDSKPRIVTELHRGHAPLYNVIPTKGDSFVVNDEHVLSLHTISRNRNKSRRRDCTVELTIKQILARGKRFFDNFFLYRAAVEFPSAVVTLDPYFMGLWLGDGTNSAASITSADREIADYLEDFVGGYPALKLTISPKPDNLASRYDLALRERDRPRANPLITLLRQNNLFRNKHIPRNYLVNDRETRLKVLAGLIDSDGHYDKNGGFEFSTKYEHLATEVEFLARSLGFSAYAKPCVKSSQTGFTATYHRMLIYGGTDQVPTRVVRKKAALRATHYANGKRTRNVLHTGFKLEPVGLGDYYGFTLTGDGLYLLGDFTVTHNSGKGSATKDFFVEADYPIRVDQVTDNLKKANALFDRAKNEGFQPEYVFVDRKPDIAWSGVVGRAVRAREKGKPARTVPIDVAMKANLEARRTAIEILKTRPDVMPQVLDNSEGQRRLLTDRDEAVKFLEDRLKEDEAGIDAAKARSRQQLLKEHAAGKIPTDIARGLFGAAQWEKHHDAARLPEPAAIPQDNPIGAELQPAADGGLDQPGRHRGDAGGGAATDAGAGSPAPGAETEAGAVDEHAETFAQLRKTPLGTPIKIGNAEIARQHGGGYQLTLPGESPIVGDRADMIAALKRAGVGTKPADKWQDAANNFAEQLGDKVERVEPDGRALIGGQWYKVNPAGDGQFEFERQDESSAPPETPEVEKTADQHADAIKAMYDRSGDTTIPMEHIENALAPLDDMSKAELIDTAAKLEMKATKGKTRAEITKMIRQRLLDRRSAAQRANMIAGPASADEQAKFEDKPNEQPVEGTSDDNLERTSREGDRGGLPSGGPVGEDAGAAPRDELPDAGRGPEAVEGLGAVPAGDDQRSAGPGGPAGRRGGDAGDLAGAGTSGAVEGAERPAVATRGVGTRKRGGGLDGSGPAIPNPTPVEESLDKPPAEDNPTDASAGNFTYTDRDFFKGGPKAKFTANVAAIRLLREMEAEGRTSATPEEQAILSKFTGWGQFPQVFNHHDEGWSKERQILQGLLGDDEFAAARRSTLNAHYTHPDVVDAHWNIAKRLGFTGGRYLETSAGIGYYLGLMPPELAAKTKSTAVELDPTPGAMLKMLYPKANVQIQGFEKHQSPPGFYDLVASNVPFGDYKVHDPEYNRHQANIHDYFFLKSIDKVRPGGLVMHITSRYTLDKGDPRIREELAKHCDLVGAVRFPAGAHKENAGTEVVTDMVILRKRLPGEAPSGPSWLETTKVPDPDGGEPMDVNRYFAEHPEQILGRLDRSGTMYAGDQINVVKTDDYEQRLQAAINRLPEKVMSSNRAPRKRFEPEAMPAPGDIKDGGFQVKGSKVYVRDGGAMIERQLPASKVKRLEGHLGLRDAARAVLNAQLEGKSADAARAELNRAYDTFVAKFGPINDRTNKQLFRDDPDSPLLMAMEKYDPKTKQATKADIFRKDTIRSLAPVEHAGTVPEALGVSLHETGGIDLEHMAKLTGHPVEHIAAELTKGGLAFEDPSAGYQPAEQYLSGNVRRKLALARAAAAADPKFTPNVEALEKVQPEDVDHNDIEVKLGAPWVPSTDVAEFAGSLLGGQADHFHVQYAATNGQWFARYTSKGDARLSQTKQATDVWGTPRMQFDDLLEAGLNNKTPLIYDKDSDGNSVLNKEATADAQAKVQEIKDKFKEWVWEADERRTRLHRHYNDNFNNVRHLKYDGSHLKFPGMNPSFKLHKHIPDFVWQVVTTGKGLAAHEVGTGKTACVVASAMELRRLGLARKPAIACLKANIGQITAEALHLYPGAKILSTEHMFDAASRKKTISQIATGDYDMVILTHDHMDLLQMKPGTVEGYIRQEIDELEAAKTAATAEGGKGRGNRVVKALEKAKANLEAKLKEALDDSKKDDAVFFEETGIDQLFVDECFPGSTLVETIDGLQTISDIVEREYDGLVLTLNRETAGLEWKPVTARFKRSLRNHLVRVIHEQGSFICTPNHNIWTEEDGYVQAGLLRNNHTLRLLPRKVTAHSDAAFSDEAGQATILQQELLRSGANDNRAPAMQAVPATVRCPHRDGRSKTPVLHQAVCPTTLLVRPEAQGSVQSGNAGQPHASYSPRVVPSYEGKQSDAEHGHARESSAETAWKDILSTGRQRSANEAATAAGIRHEMADGASHRYRTGQGPIPVASELLQGGSGQRGTQDRHRSGWPDASTTSLEVPGPTQNRDTQCARVVGVALHQRAGDDRTCDGRAGDSFVYDIEVAATHNYFADGVNVSNSHKYKSLPCYTKQDRLKGIPTSRSNRATSMLMRTRWLQEQNNGRGVVFATGTPVANTMAELYNMQRYLQPQELKERGLEAFDAWANVFGDVQTRMESTVSGEYKPVSRFARFVNIPELMQLTRQFMDVQRIDALPNTTINRPKRHDNAIVAPKTDAVERLMKQLQARAKDIKGPAQKGADNMLAICTDGRKGSIDMRLLNAANEDDPQSKTNLCVDNVLKLHKADPAKTQLIFSDMGVNPTKDGFHLYGDIIDKLVAGGIPRDQIADFSQLEGPKKEQAMEQMRKGEMTIGIGSTAKLGTGVNVQNHLAHLHHIDVPWLPADVEQRDGRGWRHGNENKDLGIHRYVTEGSLDQTFWQIIGNKTRFIRQVMTPSEAKAVGRTASDEDTEELTPDQLMAAASGDPRIMEKVQVDEDIRTLDAARKRHDREQARFRDSISATERNIPRLEKRVERVKKMAEVLTKNPEFELEIGGEKYRERKDADEAFAKRNESIDRNTPSWDASRRETMVGIFRGLTLMRRGQRLHLLSDDGEEFPTGDSLRSVEAIARQIGTKHVEEAEAAVKQAHDDVKKVKSQIGKTFPKQKEYQEKLERKAALEKELAGKKDEEKPAAVE